MIVFALILSPIQSKTEYLQVIFNIIKFLVLEKVKQTGIGSVVRVNKF